MLREDLQMLSANQYLNSVYGLLMLDSFLSFLILSCFRKIKMVINCFYLGEVFIVFQKDIYISYGCPKAFCI